MLLSGVSGSGFRGGAPVVYEPATVALLPPWYVCGDFGACVSYGGAVVGGLSLRVAGGRVEGRGLSFDFGEEAPEFFDLWLANPLTGGADHVCKFRAVVVPTFPRRWL